MSELEGYFKSLYKYVTYETGIEIIKNQTLRFSKPSIFNDPLDCYDGLFEIDESYFPILVQKKFPKATQQQQNQILIKVKNNFKTHEKEIMNLFTKERNRILIACFSKSSEKLLMWSYYTNSHSGLCFEYYTDRQIKFNTYGDVLPLEVKYKSLQQKIKYKYEGISHLIDWVTIKSYKWEDEEEVRWILFSVNDRRDYVDIQFPKTFLKKVILGYNMKSQQRKYIVKLVKEHFEGVQIAFSEIVIDKKMMDIKEIPYEP